MISKITAMNWTHFGIQYVKVGCGKSAQIELWFDFCKPPNVMQYCQNLNHNNIYTYYISSRDSQEKMCRSHKDPSKKPLTKELYS